MPEGGEGAQRGQGRGEIGASGGQDTTRRQHKSSKKQKKYVDLKRTLQPIKLRIGHIKKQLDGIRQKDLEPGFDYIVITKQYTRRK